MSRLLIMYKNIKTARGAASGKNSKKIVGNLKLLDSPHHTTSATQCRNVHPPDEHSGANTCSQKVIIY